MGEKSLQNELEHLREKTAALEEKCARLEKSLRESEDRFQKIFHASSNPMAITTVKEGRIIDLNEANASLGGWAREELLGTVATNRSLWADPKQRSIVIRKLQEEGRVHNQAIGWLTRTGETLTVLFSADPIVANGEPCLLSVSVDISAQEREAKALRESEEKYRTLVEKSLQGLTIIQDDRFIFCNSAFAAMVGYSIEELSSLTPEQMEAMVHPGDRAAMMDRYQNRLAGRLPSSRYEYRAIKKDGAKILLEVYASLINYNGKPAVQSAYMDITERRQAENALRESDERFRLIAETIDEIFLIYDMEKEVTTYISPALDRVWGYSRESLLGDPKHALDAIHPEDRERVYGVFAAAKAGQLLNFEYRVIRPDGSIRHIWIRGFPVPDESGRVKRYVGVGQDVTARRNAEEALRESREYLNQLINGISDPIYVKDRKHRFVLVNDAFCKFTGTPRESFLGKTGLEMMPAEMADAIKQQQEDFFKTGGESLTEDNLVDGQGNSRTLLTKKSLLTDKSGNKQLVGVLRDITEHKRLEAQFLQAQKMEAIGVLAGGVAHDFNNLLNVINGYSELILDDLTQDNPIRKDVEQVRQAGLRASSLTSQLLAFGRKQILQPVILDLNTIISQMHSMLRRLIGEDIEIATITQPGLGLINADPGQIQQIVMNLAVNARDAMPKGGKLIIETADVDFDEDYVREHPIAKAGPHVMLAISDNGEGMDAATQAHLFEPFFTTKEKGRGTGLGLSTVYGIVQQSNGFIWVYSEPTKGTVFKIYFPRSADRTDGDTAESQLKSGYHGTGTVLVVEDEAAVRALAGRVLRDRGYSVLEASQGMEALRIAREYSGEIHLIVTDVIMPGMSGSALVSQLQAERPGIKALYISGYTDNAIVRHGILDSNIAFLQKPFTVSGFSRKVQDVLRS